MKGKCPSVLHSCATFVELLFLCSMVTACSAASLDAPRTPHNDAEGLRSLINVIKKEEITIHVDIASKMQVRSCAPSWSCSIGFALACNTGDQDGRRDTCLFSSSGGH